MSDPKTENSDEPVGGYLCYALITVQLLDFLFIDSKGTRRPFAISVAFVVVWIICAAWLVLKRCKFTASQMLLSLLVMGIQMALLAYFKPLRYMPTSDLIFISCLPVLTFVGLFIGARLADDPKVQTSIAYWVRFLIGLLLPTLLVLLSEVQRALAGPR